ncbi:ribonuclease H-like domain-containing protein [Tanacetum coccineum]|uniref:Ribonuclease H-like domain-containing protein n=1 Tax=Tanacetum coccineum TaxID=301880 RepID=A0ABQ5J8W0_9ASTR
MIDCLSIVEINKVIHTVETDIVKLMVEIESFCMSSDEFDKETGSSDGLQPKQADTSFVYVLNELHLHEIRVVPIRLTLESANSVKTRKLLIRLTKETTNSFTANSVTKETANSITANSVTKETANSVTANLVTKETANSVTANSMTANSVTKETANSVTKETANLVLLIRLPKKLLICITKPIAFRIQKMNKYDVFLESKLVHLYPKDTRSDLPSVAETCWLRNLLRELHTPLSSATLVYCDNGSVVYLYSNPVQRQYTKHIEIDIHFVRDLVDAGEVRVFHVPSRYQYVDIFTKGLPSALFEELRTSLSVRCPLAQTAGEC